MRAVRLAPTLAAIALGWLAVSPARAELRISNLDVVLNDYEVTAQAVLLGAIPDSVREGIASGLPVHVRFTVELWQYHRLLPDRLLVTRVVERSLAYNVVSREYRVAALKGETRPVYVTRDLREAQRVLSELTGLKLSAADALDPAAVVYVRLAAEAALKGDHTVLARMAGRAEQIVGQSDYRTIERAR
jgi:hypothetical protein